MKKVLITASVASMIDQFNRSNIDLLRDMGVQVDVACNFEEGNTCSDREIQTLRDDLRKMGVSCFQVDYDRNVFHLKKMKKAYRQLRALSLEQYSFIHCQSPIGGVLGRIAARKKQTPVIYTAHGFHFFKNAGWKNWAFYFPVEWLLAKWTEVLITVNQEDYEFALRHHMGKSIEHIPGIGVDTEFFKKASAEMKAHYRKKRGISEEQTLILSVGELSERKNHQMALQAVAGLDLKQVCYCICGIGGLDQPLKKLVEDLGIQSQVMFPGFQEDIRYYYWAADIFLFPSLQEGLPVAVLEAMACGLPVVCSDIRGNRELIETRGGYLVEPKDSRACIEALQSLMESSQLREQMGNFNLKKIKFFDQKIVERQMYQIYARYIG